MDYWKKHFVKRNKPLLSLCAIISLFSIVFALITWGFGHAILTLIVCIGGTALAVGVAGDFEVPEDDDEFFLKKT